MLIHQNLRAIAYMARHDPLPIIGFCFLGIGAVLFSHILLKLNRAKRFGVADWRHDSGYRLPSEYLRVRKQCGWSPWPAYLIWPFYVVGAALLIIGLFQWGR